MAEHSAPSMASQMRRHSSLDSTKGLIASVWKTVSSGWPRASVSTARFEVEETSAEKSADAGRRKHFGALRVPRCLRRFPLPDLSRECSVIKEEASQPYLAESWKRSKKWWTLAVLAVVQVSMNFNASVYGNAVPGLKASFHASDRQVLRGQWLFLIFYAFGCELWAPWSEDFGRHAVLQGSLWAVNLWQVMGGAAQSLPTVIGSRVLGGLSSAGGSVTLGVVADMYRPEDTQKPVAFVVFWSVMGSVVGPVFGALVQRFVPSWRWVFWTQLILGSAAALLHLMAPETRSKVRVKRRAQDLRAEGNNAASEHEYNGEKLTLRKCYEIWIRPFHMFLCEPVVLSLSLLSGFSDALIFMFLQAYGEVYGTLWGFGVIANGLAFVPLAIGYAIGYLLHYLDIESQQRTRAKLAKEGKKMQLERKLRLLLFTAPLEFVGLLIFGICSIPTLEAHWLGPMFASVLVGIANYSIYMATIDYMVEAYGPYASSATGGNGFARDLLAGISALYAKPLYRQVGRYPLMSGSIILTGVCVAVLAPIYVFYYCGGFFKKRSTFMNKVMEEREQMEANRVTRIHGPVEILGDSTNQANPDDGVLDAASANSQNSNDKSIQKSAGQ